MLLFLTYCAVGRLCIFFLQKFPWSKLPLIGRYWQPGGFLHELFACDLCLGVYVYTFWAAFFQVDLLGTLFYLPFASELVTGATTSLLVHLARIGFAAEYSVIRMD